MNACAECDKKSDDEGPWQPGEFLLFGTLYVCSRECGEKYARTYASDGYRPGERWFELVEPALELNRIAELRKLTRHLDEEG